MESARPALALPLFFTVGLVSVVAALSVPVTLDLAAPLASPGGGLLFLGILMGFAAAVAAVVALIRKSKARPQAVAYLFGVVLMVFGALMFAPNINYDVGTPWALSLAGLAMLVSLAVAFVWLPTRKIVLFAALPALLVIVIAPAFADPATSGPKQAERLVRRSARLAPGYGPTSLASWTRRRLTAEPGLLEHMAKASAALEVAASDENAAPWNDDARLMHAWLETKLAAAPGLPENGRRERLRGVADALLAYAADDDAALEPWTAKGILVGASLEETEDLVAPDALRFRIAQATEATRQWLRPDVELGDPDGELAAHAQLRRLYEDNQLDLTHGLYVASIIIEAGRYKEREQWDRLVAFYDVALAHPWPPELQRPMQRERDEAAAKQEESLQ